MGIFIDEHMSIMFPITLGVYLTIGWIVGLIQVKKLITTHKHIQLCQLAEGRELLGYWLFGEAGVLLIAGGVLGSFAAIIAAAGWAFTIPAFILSWILFGIINILDWYNQEEKVVLRLLSNNPEVLETILQDKDHTYYNITKKLETSGVIKFNGDTVEIDGKIYKLKIK